MAAPDFQYEEFAQNLAAQAHELVPQEFSEEQKQYVIQTLGNFSMMAGKALAEDPNLDFNTEQSTYITQIIAEWSFHKSVDVIRSGIPRQYWDSVMQKIAYTIFEISKQAFGKNLPNEQIIELIEHHVNKAYVDALTELKDRGIIDEGLMEFAASQSNMNKMAQEMQQQAQAAENGETLQNSNTPVIQEDGTVISNNDVIPKIESKVLKLATVAMLFKKMNRDKVQAFLNKFDDKDAQDVIKYMQVPNLTEKVGVYNAIRCLQEIKNILPKDVDLTPLKVVTKIKTFASKYSEKDLEVMMTRERIGVKRLVFTALEDKYYDKMPPKVAGIIATHLQNIV